MKDRPALRIICLTLIIKISVKAYEIQEAQQSSTNGSYVASLGCDGDMDTFSLTNYGDNESWSVLLDNIYKISWVFVRIRAGSYEFRIELRTQGTTSDKCSDIKSVTAEMPDVIGKIVTCSYSDNSVYKLGNKLTVTSMQRGVMQVFEITPLGFSQLDKELVQNFSNFPASEALDDDLETYYHSESRNNASWFLKLKEVKVIKWILISIRGGQFEIHISVGNTAMSLATRCKAFVLPGLMKQQQTAIECDKALRGDTVIVKKMDDGPLRLFEVYPIICPLNHFGPNCARCRQRCQSCDTITGECTECNGSYYGEYCQHSCPRNCLNSTCDQRTGSCYGCVDNYKGKTCEQYIVPNTNRSSVRCNHSFVTCEQNIKVCLLCTSSLKFAMCKYSCEEICSGSSCLGIEENETVQKCDATTVVTASNNKPMEYLQDIKTTSVEEYINGV